MRGKKHDVCHDCRQRKIGCDGSRPACSQCQLTGRVCRGYLQDLVVFHHKPASRHSRLGKKTVRDSTNHRIDDTRLPPTSSLILSASTRLARECQQPTWDECVALLVQYYIPKDEIPFLLHVEPSKSRICGGWVQALPHVSQDHADFKHIVSPAVQALTMSMLVNGTNRRQEYIDTYGVAIEGIRAILDNSKEPIGPTVAIASMCLALSEVLVPTSSNGYKTHLRGVTAMMQTRSPSTFINGVAHLMFVGVRPLVVIDSILQRKATFLNDEQWQNVPFAVHPASRMQELLGHATAIPSLLEIMKDEPDDPQTIRSGFLKVLSTLKEWEENFVSGGMMYRSVAPSELDFSTNIQLLPNPCFAFADVSQANSLSHCWAFRIVCLLQLSQLDSVTAGSESNSSLLDHRRFEEVKCLCDMICRALPYLLQKEMRFYGSMSAGFPLHMVSESLQTLQSEDCGFKVWHGAINEQMKSQRIALYEEMVENEALY